jgi:DNA (cytosine-5)-methyltransferase 1
MNVLDLFSGIGGFSIGFERAGHKTMAFCEIDEFCQKVLKKNWPHIPIYSDVTKLTKKGLEKDGIKTIDIITGGFPCQDLSSAGNQKGIIEGARSNLWGEMCRLIGEIRPKYAIMENVTGLLTGDRGAWFGKLLRDLAALGYNAEWHCIRASAVGLPHSRDRVWIIAHPAKERPAVHAQILNRAAIESAWKTSEQILGNPSWEWLLVNGDLRDYRKHNGLSQAAYRVGSCGNAVVPRIVEIIGKQLK